MRFLDKILSLALTTINQALQQPSIRTPIAITFGAIVGVLCRYYIGKQWQINLIWL